MHLKKFEAALKKIKIIVRDILLYSDRIESIIKNLIWCISWIGGIAVLNTEETKQGLSSAYLIFSLSLLMEFAITLNKKKYASSLFLHSLFCLSNIVLLLMSISVLLGIDPNDAYYNTMFNLSLAVVMYIFINLILSFYNYEIKEEQTTKENKETKIYEEQEIFMKNLYSGNLGENPFSEVNNERIDSIIKR